MNVVCKIFVGTLSVWLFFLGGFFGVSYLWDGYVEVGECMLGALYVVGVIGVTILFILLLRKLMGEI